MDLVAEFASAIEPLGADPLFRRWGGMALTSCLLGRRVWTSTLYGLPLYPHLYVMLVAGSGYGKSMVIECVHQALMPFSRPEPGVANSWAQVAFAPAKITFPQLEASLGRAFSEAHAEAGLGVGIQCYALIAEEIGALLGEKAGIEQLQDMALIWDMRHEFAKETREGEKKKTNTRAIEHYMVALLGAQPAWIEEALGLSRFQLGTPARTHFVLPSGPGVRVRLSQHQQSIYDKMRADLLPTMRYVSKVIGYCPWAEDAFNELQDWREAGSPGRDGQIREWGKILESYGKRRAEHVAKMALVQACARGHTTISLEDWRSALDLLWTTEECLGEIAAMVGANPHRYRENEIVDWVKSRGEVEEPALRAYMRNFIDTRYIGMTLDELERSGLLENLRPSHNSPHRKFGVVA